MSDLKKNLLEALGLEEAARSGSKGGKVKRKRVKMKRMITLKGKDLPFAKRLTNELGAIVDIFKELIQGKGVNSLKLVAARNYLDKNALLMKFLRNEDSSFKNEEKESSFLLGGDGGYFDFEEDLNENVGYAKDSSKDNFATAFTGLTELHRWMTNLINNKKVNYEEVIQLFWDDIGYAYNLLNSNHLAL